MRIRHSRTRYRLINRTRPRNGPSNDTKTSYHFSPTMPRHRPRIKPSPPRPTRNQINRPSPTARPRTGHIITISSYYHNDDSTN